MEAPRQVTGGTEIDGTLYPDQFELGTFRTPDRATPPPASKVRLGKAGLGNSVRTAGCAVRLR